MSHYVIGDVQGCLTTLKWLINRLDFNAGKDTLYFVGDIVNRGPESLETLRFIKAHDNCMQSVLGNHDLYLLSFAVGCHKHYKKKDTIAPIIEAPDKWLLLDWLRHQPFALLKHDYLIVHAGVHPNWSLTQTLINAKELSDRLKSNDYINWLFNLFGDLPDIDDSNLEGFAKLRFNVNVLTRMRALDKQSKRLDFKFKSTLDEMPLHLQPWFEFDNSHFLTTKILFGHWSSIGVYRSNYAIALDSGVVWGGELSAFNLKTKEIISVPSQLKPSLLL